MVPPMAATFTLPLLALFCLSVVRSRPIRHLQYPDCLLLDTLAPAIIPHGRGHTGMAEHLLHGDEINVGSEQILVNGTPPRITSGTGVTWGKSMRGGAHTRCASMIRAHGRTVFCTNNHHSRHQWRTSSVSTTCCVAHATPPGDCSRQQLPAGESRSQTARQSASSGTGRTVHATGQPRGAVRLHRAGAGPPCHE